MDRRAVKDIRCCVGLISLLFLFSGPAPAAEKVYVNGIDANFPPFAFVNKGGRPDGLDVKALDWIAGEMGFRVRHQPMDWDGIIQALNEEAIDIIASGMSITDKAREQVEFTVPYWTIRRMIVVRQETTLSLKQMLFEGNKLGVRTGSTEAGWIEQNLIKKEGRPTTLVYYDSTALAIEDLLKGRIVGIAMDDADAREAVMKQPVKIAGGFGMPDENFAYAVRKQDVRLLQMLNEGLMRLMASPRWEELKKIYAD